MKKNHKYKVGQRVILKSIAAIFDIHIAQIIELVYTDRYGYRVKFIENGERTGAFAIVYDEHIEGEETEYHLREFIEMLDKN